MVADLAELLHRMLAREYRRVNPGLPPPPLCCGQQDTENQSEPLLAGAFFQLWAIHRQPIIPAGKREIMLRLLQRTRGQRSFGYC